MSTSHFRSSVRDVVNKIVNGVGIVYISLIISPDTENEQTVANL